MEDMDTDRVVVSEKLMLSVAVKVITCVPNDRLEVTVSPVPISPSLFEVHTRAFPDSVPSSGSVADPLKTISSALVNVLPVEGEVICTVGH